MRKKSQDPEQEKIEIEMHDNRHDNRHEERNENRDRDNEKVRHGVVHQGFISNQDISGTLKRLKNINPNIEEWADIFDVYDSDKNGWVSTSDVPDILKSLNLKINDVEVGQLIKENDKYHTGYMTKKEFLEIFACYGENYNNVDHIDIIDSFKIFDEMCNGNIGNQDMIDILTKHGEKLSVDDAVDLLTELNYDGSMSYLSFVKNNPII